MKLVDKVKGWFYEGDDENLTVDTKEINEIKEIKEEKKEPVINENSNVIRDSGLPKGESSFKFPITFGDDDFMDDSNKKSINAMSNVKNKYVMDSKPKVKPENKVFKVSPVISPVYGILDKNYKKSDIVSKDGLSNDISSSSKVDLDSVMKKAYGDVSVKTEVIVSREEKYSNISKDEEESEIDLFDKKPTKDIYEEEAYDLEDIDNRIKSIDEILKETNDDDFYSLVDNMYKDEGEGE